MNSATHETLDLGNNESLVRGVFPNPDGTFTAMTYTRSKTFKTERGALAWVARRGGPSAIVTRPETVVEYTVSPDAEVVSVSEFRSRIEHLETLVRVDRQACAHNGEVARWARIAQRIGSELIHTTCKRAKVEDWDRRERAIEASTTALVAAGAA